MSDKDYKSDKNKKDDNVVPFAKPTIKAKPAVKKTPAPKIETKIIMPSKDNETAQPIINMPPVTKYFLGLIIAVHLIITFALSDQEAANIYTTYGFIPAFWNSDLPFKAVTLMTPLSHMLLHGSWLHIAMNAVMLMAFGSGVERGLGAKNMIFIFIFSGLCGIGLQYALDPDSIHPVIAESGGLSGLFAAAFVLIGRMQKQRGMPPSNLWKFIGIWVVISLVFGFFGGFGALKLLKII
jgi:membrane associated rhomboid family serine protease